MNAKLQKTLLLSVCSATLFASSTAYADNLFLLQMGVFSSEERASQQIATMEKAHGNALAGKRYILRKSRPLSGGNVGWRVLVGPFDDRRGASRSCSELKVKGADCFVVETARVNIEEFEDATLLASQSEPVTAEAPVIDTPVASEVTSGAIEAPGVKAQTQGTSSSSVSNILPWNWFDGQPSQSPTPSTTVTTTATAAEPVPAPIKEEKKQAPSTGSNININTHAIYADKQPKTKPVPNIADLFDFSSSADEEKAVATKAPTPTPAPKPEPEPIANPVQPVQPVSTVEPSIELPQTPEQALQSATHQKKPTIEETLEGVTLKAAKKPVKRTAEVEVAEAIPVPLMEPKDVPVTVSKPTPPPSKQQTLLNVQLPNTARTQPAPVVTTPSPLPTPVTAPKPVVVAAPAPTIQPAPPAPATITVPKPAATVAPTPQPIPSVIQPSTAPTMPSQVPLTTYQTHFQNNRLLQVSVFKNDREAFACLSHVQSNVRGATGLRTRIIKSTVGQAVLRFGPIRNPQLEIDICDATSQCGQALRCRVLTEKTGRKPLRAIDPDARGHRGLSKPKDISPRHLTPGTPTLPRRALPGGPVWIQLGTSSSQSDAQSRFSGLQKQHGDLLGNHSPTISKPQGQSLAGNVYRLRIGPFNTRSDAQGLCAKLSSRGVGCLILGK